MNPIFLLATLAMLCSAEAHASKPAQPSHIEKVTALQRVCGDGVKTATLILTYSDAIQSSSLSRETYEVAGKEILNVYANTRPEPTQKPHNGRYVIVELRTETDINGQPPHPSAESDAARKRLDSALGPGLKAGYSLGGGSEPTDSVTIRQVRPIKRVKGSPLTASSATLPPSEWHTQVADDFTQHEFISPFTHQVLPYNLYLPKDYNPANRYPLVLFIHDAGVASSPVRSPLLQGRGAIVWAEPEWQANHPCIVVAPQYPVVTVDDTWNYSHHLDATIALVRDLQTRYAIDPDRIYTTGQSMGCMSSMVLMLKEPHLFAGALLVAGKWTPEVLAPLAGQNLWIVSCEGDAHSTELQNKAVALWRSNFNTVAEGTWDMLSSAEEFEKGVQEMTNNSRTHLFYSHLKGGNHRATWFVAYDIRGIREWLFSQRRRDILAQPTAKTAWVDPITSVADGCQYVLYPQKQRGTGAQGSLMVYLPEGYYESQERYPVIYYLHGGTGNQREGRWMISRIDRAIKAGQMKKVIVVCPQALPIGWYVNGRMEDSLVQTGPIEDVLINDMIPFVDSHFRTIASREGRALEGFSMGGGGTMRLAFKHPDLFCGASSVAGALVHWNEEPSQRTLECTFGAVGNPESRAYFDSLLPDTFAIRNAQAIKAGQMKIRMFVGTADRLYIDKGTHITERFSQLLDSLQISHTLKLIPGANHNPEEIFAPELNPYDTHFWDECFSKARRKE